jgi:hypothetical protein
LHSWERCSTMARYSHKTTQQLHNLLLPHPITHVATHTEKSALPAVGCEWSGSGACWGVQVFEQAAQIPAQMALAEYMVGGDYSIWQYLCSVRGQGTTGLPVHKDDGPGW